MKELFHYLKRQSNALACLVWFGVFGACLMLSLGSYVPYQKAWAESKRSKAALSEEESDLYDDPSEEDEEAEEEEDPDDFAENEVFGEEEGEEAETVRRELAETQDEGDELLEEITGEGEDDPELKAALEEQEIGMIDEDAVDEAEIDELLGEEDDEEDFEGGAEREIAEDDGFDELVEEAQEEQATQTPVPVSEPEEVPQPVATGPAVVKNLEFKMFGRKSRIIVSFDNRPQFQESRNPEMRQVIYYFEDTKTPQLLQRAYDTREFISPVGLFTLLQSEEGSSKLIVQLREAATATTKWSGSNLLIEFPSPTQASSKGAGDSIGGLPIQKGNAQAMAFDNDYVEENIYATGRKFTGTRIERLEIKDSDVQDVLRLIARSSGYNIVIGESVKGKVGTLSLRNVPWDQAFTLVLQSKKLGYIRQGNVLRVATLTALKAEKDAAVANESSKLRVESLRTVLIPISYADSKELAARAKPFLSERGKIDTDSRTNTIIVRDVKKVTERVQKLLLALDTQPPRVSISARIIEMVSTYSRQLGFSNITASDNFSGVNLEQDFTADFGAFSTTTISAPRLANLTARFKLGQLENKVQILANPQVTAVNNQKANVTQSITQFLPESVSAGGVQTSTFREIKANLSLDVTPIVSGDGGVFMNVVVTNEVPTGPPENKQIDTRSVTTQVLVENGDTAVIGGIYNSTKSTSMQGIPWLMKVPILGFFVSNQTEEENRNEILVFLTPKILNAKESFSRES